jgi:hypothetical protein
MNQISDRFNELLLFYLEYKRYIVDKNCVTIFLEIEKDYKGHQYIYLSTCISKKHNYKISFPKTIKENSHEYILNINRYLFALYSKMQKFIKSNVFLHICYKCKNIFYNTSHRFHNEYECLKCKGMLIDNTKNTIKSKDMVYFFRSTMTGLIKIGISGNVNNRKKALEKKQGCKLEILKIINGGSKKERELHEMFAEFRTIGEWFEPDKKILDYIKGVKIGD